MDSIFLTSHKCICIAGTAQNPDNDDFGVGIAITKSVIPEKVDAQTGDQVIAAAA